MDRAECATGASCAFWALGRAVGAASASGAGGRVSRNEQVVGSIPTGGSLSSSSVMFIDLNFDGLSIAVERFVERVVWSGRPDARVSWLRSVIDGSCVSSARPRRPGKDRPASCAPGGRAACPRLLGSSMRSASCAFPRSQSSATLFRGVQCAAGLRGVLCARQLVPCAAARRSRELTRPLADGGRDAADEYLPGPAADPVAVAPGLEAKCCAPATGVAAPETSRLISHLRHRAGWASWSPRIWTPRHTRRSVMTDT